MANPNVASIDAQLKAVCALVHSTRRFGAATTPNFVGLHDAITAVLESDYARDIKNGAAAFRAAYAQVLTSQNPKNMLNAVVRTYGKLIKSPGASATAILPDLYDYFVANSRTVKSREMTFGSPTAGGSNAGSGTLQRVTKDADGNDIEGADTDEFTATCIGAEGAGAVEHAEQFVIQGTAPGVAPADGGVAASNVLTASNANTTQTTLANPSFDNLTPTTVGSALTALPSWTVSDFADIVVSDDTFRGAQGVTAPRAIRLNTNRTISQDLRSVTRTTPYLVRVAWMRKDSADGTLKIKVGGIEKTVDVSTGTNDVWNILYIDRDDDAWPSNWSNVTPTLELSLASNTTGGVVLDDVVVEQMTRHAGTWWKVDGGATPFEIDDVFTMTDSEGTAAVIQNELRRLFPNNQGGGGFYLPATAVSPTVTDPTVL